MDIQLKSLIQKLNTHTKTALEAAAGLCLSETHHYVELEHYFIKLLDQDNLDIHFILKHYDISAEHVVKDLFLTTNTFKRGNTRTPGLSQRLPNLIEKAWMVASLICGENEIRSGHILLALLNDPENRRVMVEASAAFRKLPKEDLQAHFHEIAQNSFENSHQMLDEDMADEPNASTMAKQGKTPALDQYTINLTARAKSGALDPVLGRDGEIRQMIDILTRRRQNNPILTGEAGVGKTAVVEGLALKIHHKDVPPILAHVALHTLDLGLLQAGASVKGEFENRLKSVIDEVKKSPHPIILFIDEAHTLIGAGGQEGGSDAANLLKPALARGELRTIAATTWSEYKKYFEKDAALARRFQVVKIEEPDEAKAVAMLRGVARAMEAHHHVLVKDHAIIDAVHLSHRYITGRQLPDKGVSVLDTACARVGISQNSTPGVIEDIAKQLDVIHTEIQALEHEETLDSTLSHKKRLTELKIAKTTLETELKAYQTQWEKEKKLVEHIIQLRTQITESKKDDIKKLQDKLAKQKTELEQVQGKSPLIHIEVTPQTVGEVISGWTGIPLGKMLADEIETVQNLDKLLKERVIGQDHALKMIAERIQTSRAGLDDPNRPIGVFMLAGPSGVGKTETALSLADILYGGERNLITINMSEYQEAHTVSALKGSPPGYVGYGEGGVLTEAVRRKPYSVVLLDEVEKAHPDVLELFYQVFDKGMLDDGEGREIDFKNTVIILTTNIGTDTIMHLCERGKKRPETNKIMDKLNPELRHTFKPAFMGRMVVAPYYPVSDEVLKNIIKLKISKIQKRIKATHKADLIYDDKLINLIHDRCQEVDSGARNIDHILTGSVLPSISEQVLSFMKDEKPFQKITIKVSAKGDITYDIR